MPIGVPRIIYCWGEELPAQWTDIYNFIFRRRMVFLMQYLDDELCNQICGLLINIHMEDRSKELEKKEMEKSGIGLRVKNVRGTSKLGGTSFSGHSGGRDAKGTQKQNAQRDNLTGPISSEFPPEGETSQGDLAQSRANKKKAGPSFEDLLAADEDLGIEENNTLEHLTLQKITMEWLNWNAQFFDYTDEPYLFYLAEILSKDFGGEVFHRSSSQTIPVKGEAKILYSTSRRKKNYGGFPGETKFQFVTPSPFVLGLPRENLSVDIQKANESLMVSDSGARHLEFSSRKPFIFLAMQRSSVKMTTGVSCCHFYGWKEHGKKLEANKITRLTQEGLTSNPPVGRRPSFLQSLSMVGDSKNKKTKGSIEGGSTGPVGTGCDTKNWAYTYAQFFTRSFPQRGKHSGAIAPGRFFFAPQLRAGSDGSAGELCHYRGKTKRLLYTFSNLFAPTVLRRCLTLLWQAGRRLPKAKTYKNIGVPGRDLLGLFPLRLSSFLTFAEKARNNKEKTHLDVYSPFRLLANFAANDYSFKDINPVKNFFGVPYSLASSNLLAKLKAEKMHRGAAHKKHQQEYGPSAKDSPYVVFFPEARVPFQSSSLLRKVKSAFMHVEQTLPTPARKNCPPFFRFSRLTIGDVSKEGQKTPLFTHTPYAPSFFFSFANLPEIYNRYGGLCRPGRNRPGAIAPGLSHPVRSCFATPGRKCRKIMSFRPGVAKPKRTGCDSPGAIAPGGLEQLSWGLGLANPKRSPQATPSEPFGLKGQNNKSKLVELFNATLLSSKKGTNNMSKLLTELSQKDFTEKNLTSENILKSAEKGLSQRLLRKKYAQDAHSRQVTENCEFLRECSVDTSIEEGIKEFPLISPLLLNYQEDFPSNCLTPYGASSSYLTRRAPSGSLHLLSMFHADIHNRNEGQCRLELAKQKKKLYGTWKEAKKDPSFHLRLFERKVLPQMSFLPAAKSPGILPQAKKNKKNKQRSCSEAGKKEKPDVFREIGWNMHNITGHNITEPNKSDFYSYTERGSGMSLRQTERTFQEEEAKKVFVIINSFGGSVGNGITVHDALQFIKAGSLTLGLGVAASAASLALAGGTIGERYVTEGCHVMIHQPEGGIQGQASDIWIDSQEIMKIRLDVAEIYSLATYRPRHKILRDLDRDFYLTATETIHYGLADEIASNEVMHEIIEMTSKVWDYHDSKQQRLLESRESSNSGVDTQSQN